MVKVYAPNPEYAGTIGDVTFRDGVAEVEDGSAVLAYVRRRGYGIGSRASKPESPTPEYPDPADHHEMFGAPLRDAAVDPRPEDYLPPINAGKAHPHGPEVVAPGIHAVGPPPIRPGEVYVDDVTRQAAEETRLAERILVGDETADILTAPADADRGPLGLSDPGSAEIGVREASGGDRPARSASKAEWVDFAVAQGMTREDAEAATRRDLTERYG